MVTLIKNIKQLVNVRKQSPLLRGNQLAKLPVIENAFLIIEDNTIADFGAVQQLYGKFDRTIDARGKFILPAWCDSHTHLVFSGSREDEFISKMKGLSYTEIAAKGGGILNSAKKLNETPEHILFNDAWKRLEEIEKWCDVNLTGHWGRLQYITDVWYWFNIPSEASLFKMTW